MKATTWILEVLTGKDVNVHILRDGHGKVVLATPSELEFLEFIHCAEIIEKEKDTAADEMEKELEEE
jgi:hypothetical protein